MSRFLTGKKYLTFVLFGCGVLLLGAKYFKHSVPEVASTSLDSSVQTPISLPTLFSGITFPHAKPDIDSADVAALFLLKPEVCAPCLNEVFEYESLLREAKIANTYIEPFVVVIDSDSVTASRLIKLAKFPMAAGVGSDIIELLNGRNGRAQSMPQQIVFIDTATETVFFRHRLLNVSTPSKHKRDMLSGMLASWDSLNQTNTGGSK